MRNDRLKETLIHGTPDFPVAVYNNTFDRQFNLLAALHYHTEFELLVATKGSLSVQIEETLYCVKEGEGLFINSGLIHSISSSDNSEHGFIAIVFDFHFLCTEHDVTFKKYIQPMINGTLKVPVTLPPHACKLVHTIKNAYENNSFGFELYAKQALLEIFHLFLEDSETTSLPVQSTKSLLMKNILNYVEQHYADSISLLDMAEHAHISKEYLCRIFNAMSDTTPVEYLNRYRIRQSTTLLVHTDRSISDIALSCGFSNSSYFNKLFLRYMSCTPSEYRKNYASF